MSTHTKPRPHSCARTASASSSNSASTNAFSPLNPDIQRAIAAEGYVTPTEIQQQCIPALLEGRDLVGCAQTGTGKTAAFALPLLHQMACHRRRPRRGTPRALVLAPTRELAAQIDSSLRTYGRHLRVSNTVVYGGVKQFGQVKALNRGVDILVATPGRLLDLMRQGHIHLNEVGVFILDEVDRMLDMGFIPDIKKVMSELPAQRQTAFFSATLAPKMKKLADSMVSNPVRVTIAPDKPAVERIDQKVMFVGKKDKNALLLSLLNDGDAPIAKALVFIQMKHAANKLVKKLHAGGIHGTAIHGNKSQAARNRALDGFKQGRFRVLVATDVAARGLDVDDITHVINYDLPSESETYVHRIGRTARAGASGDAISFCSAEDRGMLHSIEQLLGTPVPPETDHAYHCDDAARPLRSGAGKQGGGGRGCRQGGRPSNRRNRRDPQSGRNSSGGRYRASRNRGRSHASAR